MMSNKLNPDVSPAEIKVKRLNRIPLLIVLFLSIAVLAAITFMLIQSSNRHRRTAKNDKTIPYKVDDQAAKNLLAGKPEYGVIKMAQEKPTPEPALITKDNRHSRRLRPQITQKQKLSLAEKELARIRATKLKRFEQALSSSITVGGRGITQGVANAQNIISNTSARASNSSNIFDKMLQAKQGMMAGLNKND